MNQTLPKIVWLVVPIAIFVAQIGIEMLVPQEYLADLHSEGGPHEILQFGFAFIALIYALICLRNIWPQKPPLLTAWVIFFCIGCTYIAGEEVSWGQHFFNWGTSEFWSEMNDQNETNLHNISSWLDQKPKLLLFLGTIVGGLIIPALQKFKLGLLPQQIKIIYPHAIMGVTAVCILLTKIIDKGQEAIDMTIFTRASEVEEVYLFYFVLLYLVILHQRILESFSSAK